jgi:hypothetical protein
MARAFVKKKNVGKNTMRENLGSMPHYHGARICQKEKRREKHYAREKVHHTLCYTIRYVTPCGTFFVK